MGTSQEQRAGPDGSPATTEERPPWMDEYEAFVAAVESILTPLAPSNDDAASPQTSAAGPGENEHGRADAGAGAADQLDATSSSLHPSSTPSGNKFSTSSK